MGGALDIFSAVMGLCFTTTLAPDMVDRHCFSSVYADAHVRDRHVVTSKGKSVYEGETIYSATPEGIVFTYVNSSGGSGTGSGTIAGDVMTFSMTMRGDSKAEPKPYRGTWRTVPGGYEQNTDGEGVRRFVLAR